MKIEGGLYKDDGTKVDEKLTPLPNLCVICKKHEMDDFMENLLCKMNRNAQRKDVDNFECGSFMEIY